MTRGCREAGAAGLQPLNSWRTWPLVPVAINFGRGGPHLCLGAWLARMEIRVVFEELMKRVDRLEQTGPIDRLRSNFISGIKRLPVKVAT